MVKAVRSKFQSHFGSIKTQRGDGCELCGGVCFNPTLVRLKRVAGSRGSGKKMGFQSHFGSIKTIDEVYVEHARYTSFNPTLVRLKHPPHYTHTSSRQRFNPTLVRLKQFEKTSRRSDSTSFQSHFGSIKTDVDIVKYEPGRGFNPTLVRLKPNGEQKEKMRLISFNPTLVRLKHSPPSEPRSER